MIIKTLETTPEYDPNTGSATSTEMLIDLRDKEPEIRVRQTMGSNVYGIPAEVYNGLALQVWIPTHPGEDELREFLEANEDLIYEIKEGHYKIGGDANPRGKLDAYGADALERLERLIDNLPNYYSFWLTEDWLTGDSNFVDDITPYTTDESINRWAKELANYMETNHPEVIISQDFSDYALEVRERIREEAE